MDKPDREAIREIVRRRFGSRHDKPCERPETLTCAIWECQVRDRCVHAPANAKRFKVFTPKRNNE